MTGPPGQSGDAGSEDPRPDSDPSILLRGRWQWRSDRGGYGPWASHDPEMRRKMWRRARYMRQRQGGPWRFRQGFGCIFALLFLVVVASILTAIATVLSNLEPIPVVVTGLVLLGIIATLARGTAGAARDLDTMVAATQRVEEGDYGVRVGRTRSDLPPIQQLARGFDTMAARLEADEEQRRTLLADVSHELRTPLAVITGNLEAVIDGVYPPDAAHLTPILDETRIMARLIDDLRTIALSEAGTLTLHPEPTDIDVLIGEVRQAFQTGAAAAEVTLATDTSADLPILDVDPVRIREVLGNLVANALRHTPRGGTVTIGGAATPSSVTLTVRDTGPGMDPALLPHVFDRFVKGAGSRGSGLGLAIARGLVEAHGGTISVESPEGGGSTFKVELPFGTER